MREDIQKQAQKLGKDASENLNIFNNNFQKIFKIKRKDFLKSKNSKNVNYWPLLILQNFKGTIFMVYMYYTKSITDLQGRI